MNIVSPIKILDGNQYLVQNSSQNSDSETFSKVLDKELSAYSLEDIFNEAASQYGVDVNLLKAVAEAESGFDTNAVSSAGAQGIMQLMPQTAESYGVTDPFDPAQSIAGGAQMLSWLLDDYNGNVTLALAGYNAGAGAVEKYGGVPPYSETLAYISRINDILGGALESDSKTIADAKATDLSAANVSVPDLSFEGSGNGRVTKKEYVHSFADSPQDVLKQYKLNAEEESPLLSFDNYMYFMDTILDLLDQHVDEISEKEDSNHLDSPASVAYEMARRASELTAERIIQI